MLQTARKIAGVNGSASKALGQYRDGHHQAGIRRPCTHFAVVWLLHEYADTVRHQYPYWRDVALQTGNPERKIPEQVHDAQGRTPLYSPVDYQRQIVLN